MDPRSGPDSRVGEGLLNGECYFRENIRRHQSGPLAVKIFREKNPGCEGDLLELCFHEAGHAWAAWATCKPFYSVEIDDQGGRIWYSKPTEELRQTPIVTDKEKTEHDASILNDLTETFDLPKLLAETEGLIREAWGAIGSIAYALYSRWPSEITEGKVTLNALQVCAICHRHEEISTGGNHAN
jgi:hypothetical protein